MPQKNLPIVALCHLQPGQEADVFALLYLKEELRTKDGKPYYKVGFRDAGRAISFPMGNDAPLGEDCREAWKAGTFYKLRCSLKETSFGAQLEIRRIRETI